MHHSPPANREHHLQACLARRSSLRTGRSIDSQRTCAADEVEHANCDMPATMLRTEPKADIPVPPKRLPASMMGLTLGDTSLSCAGPTTQHGRTGETRWFGVFVGSQARWVDFVVARPCLRCPQPFSFSAGRAAQRSLRSPASCRRQGWKWEVEGVDPRQPVVKNAVPCTVASRSRGRCPWPRPAWSPCPARPRSHPCCPPTCPALHRDKGTT